MPKYVLRADGETDPIEAPDDATAIDLLADRVGEWVDEDRLTETTEVEEAVVRLGEDGEPDAIVETISRTFHPTRAWDCPDGEPHVFVTEVSSRLAHALLGGLAENPGVFGVPGGVVIVDRCLRCGIETAKTSLHGARFESWEARDRRRDTIEQLADWVAVEPERRVRLGELAATYPEATLLAKIAKTEE